VGPSRSNLSPFEKQWLEIGRAAAYPLAPRMKSLVIAEKPSVAADLARAWGDTASPRLIVWPLSLRVGRKQAQLHLNGHHFD